MLTPPFPELASAARAVGHTLFIFDGDGPLRRNWPLVRVGDRVIPSIALSATMLADGVKAPDVQQNVPGCPALIAWRGPAQSAAGRPTFESFSFYDLFYSQQQVLEQQKPQIDPATFRDRIVIIGVTAQGLHEVFTTPFGEGSIAGPEVHANIIDAWQQHRALTRAPLWQRVAITIALASIVGLIGYLANAWVTAAAAVALAAAFAWISVLLFARGSWISVTAPGLALVFAYVGDLAWKLVVEGREKRQIKKLFSRYVAKDVYEQLLADPVARGAWRQAPQHDRALLRRARLHHALRKGPARGRRRAS